MVRWNLLSKVFGWILSEPEPWFQLLPKVTGGSIDLHEQICDVDDNTYAGILTLQEINPDCNTGYE